MIDTEDLFLLPVFNKAIKDGYLFSNAYAYLDENDTPLFWRVRFDHPEKGKLIRPVHKTTGDVFELGIPESAKMVAGTPLFNHHYLSKFPDATVWIVEGEKCADTLMKFFLENGAEGHIALTTGSATSAEKADLTKLVNCRIIIWPDNDPEGLQYADRIAHRLEEIVTHIEVIDVAKIGLSPKGDCVDWLLARPNATLRDILSLPFVRKAAFPGAELIRVSDVQVKPISWMWPSRIAYGKISVLAGEPGLGKSQITADLAARVTNGDGWPDFPGRGSSPGSVIFLSAEDDVADTIRPRLEAAGANLDRCFCLQSFSNVDGTSRAVDLSQDAHRIRNLIAQMNDVKLIVVDPISAYMGDCEGNSNTDVRAMLAPLTILAADYMVALLLVTHFNKSSTQDMLSRVIGSIGLVGAARASYAVIKEEGKPDTRLFLPIKNNIGNDKTGLSFHIEEHELENKILSSRIAWNHGLVPVSSALQQKRATETNGAKAFLEDLLSKGPMKSVQILLDAAVNGYSKPAIQRASRALGCKKQKVGMKGPWIWMLQQHKLSDYMLHSDHSMSDAEIFEDSEGDEDVSDLSDTDTN